MSEESLKKFREAKVSIGIPKTIEKFYETLLLMDDTCLIDIKLPDHRKIIPFNGKNQVTFLEGEAYREALFTAWTDFIIWCAEAAISHKEPKP